MNPRRRRHNRIARKRRAHRAQYDWAPTTTVTIVGDGGRSFIVSTIDLEHEEC